MAENDTVAPTVRSLDQLKPDPHASVFDDPDAVLLALDEGDAMPPHSHPGTTVVIHVIDGTMTVTLDGTPHVVEADDVLRCDGECDIAPEATSDTRALIQFHGTAADAD